MTDAPKRIWAEEIGTATKGGQRFRIGRWITDETASHPHEYILASEHAALIREAEDRVWERAAVIAENVDYPWEQGEHLSQMMASDATACAIAAAIRAAKATP